MPFALGKYNGIIADQLITPEEFSQLEQALFAEGGVISDSEIDEIIFPLLYPDLAETDKVIFLDETDRERLQLILQEGAFTVERYIKALNDYRPKPKTEREETMAIIEREINFNSHALKPKTPIAELKAVVERPFIDSLPSIKEIRVLGTGIFDLTLQKEGVEYLWQCRGETDREAINGGFPNFSIEEVFLALQDFNTPERTPEEKEGIRAISDWITYLSDILYDDEEGAKQIIDDVVTEHREKPEVSKNPMDSKLLYHYFYLLDDSLLNMCAKADHTGPQDPRIIDPGSGCYSFINYLASNAVPGNYEETKWVQRVVRQYQGFNLESSATSTCRQDPDCREGLLRVTSSGTREPDSTLVVRYAESYGVEFPEGKEKGLPANNPEYMRHVFYGTEYLSGECANAELVLQSERATYVWEEEGEIRHQSFMGCKRLGKTHNPSSLYAANRFRQKYQSQFDQALQALKIRHDDIDPVMIELWLFGILLHETGVLNNTDVQQDLAAAAYANSPYLSEMRKHLALDRDQNWKTLVAALPGLGSASWRVFSDYMDIPPERQGYGLFQIIPSQVYDAYRNMGIPFDYSGVLPPEIFENKDGSPNWKGIIGASLDPEKMFALQAYRFDYALTKVEALGEKATKPHYAPPHLAEEDRREFFLLDSAQFLIAYPDMVDYFKQYKPVNNYSPWMMESYIMGDLYGTIPEWKGFVAKEFASDDLPSTAIGCYWPARKADSEKPVTCLVRE